MTNRAASSLWRIPTALLSLILAQDIAPPPQPTLARTSNNNTWASVPSLIFTHFPLKTLPLDGSCVIEATLGPLGSSVEGSRKLLLELDTKTEGIRLFEKNLQPFASKLNVTNVYDEVLTHESGFCESFLPATADFNPAQCPSSAHLEPHFYCGRLYRDKLPPLIAKGGSYWDSSLFSSDGISYFQELRTEGFDHISFADLSTRTDSSDTRAETPSPLPPYANVQGVSVANMPIKIVRSFSAQPSGQNSQYSLEGLSGSFGIGGATCGPVSALRMLTAVQNARLLVLHAKPEARGFESFSTVEVSNVPNKGAKETELNFLYETLRQNLGGTANTTAVQFSESIQQDIGEVTGLWVFSLYHPTLRLHPTQGGDRNLLNPSSIHWTGIIDMAGNCLQLPAFLLAKVALLLKLECNHQPLAPQQTTFTAEQKDDWPTVNKSHAASYCKVTDRTTLDSSLSFQLRFSHGSGIRIFMKDLAMIEPESRSVYLCLTESSLNPAHTKNSSEVKFPDRTTLGATYLPPIQFGRMALRGKTIAKDLDQDRIVFFEPVGETEPSLGGNRHGLITTTTPSCLNSPWKGYYDVSSETCLPFNCSPFLLTSWNETLQECSMHRPLVIGIFVLTGFLALSSWIMEWRTEVMVRAKLR